MKTHPIRSQPQSQPQGAVAVSTTAPDRSYRFSGFTVRNTLLAGAGYLAHQLAVVNAQNSTSSSGESVVGWTTALGGVAVFMGFVLFGICVASRGGPSVRHHDNVLFEKGDPGELIPLTPKRFS